MVVAEDESSVRTLVERALGQAGCGVQVGRDGEEALALAQRLQGRFDLLLTDVVMPRCGGLRLATAVRELWPGLRVLFMTGHSDEIRDLEAQRAPGDAVLVKPFLPQALASAVARVLDPQPGPSGPR